MNYDKFENAEATKGLSEDVNRRRTDKIQWPKEKGQTMIHMYIYNTLHRSRGTPTKNKWQHYALNYCTENQGLKNLRIGTGDLWVRT